MTNAVKILVGKPQGTRPLRTPRITQESISQGTTTEMDTKVH